MSLALPRRPVATLDTSFAIVNVVLLLLFFFLATGTRFGGAGADTELAQTTRLPIRGLDKPVLVVGPDGGLTLDGAPIPAGVLGPAIRAATEEPRPVLHVVIDGSARASDLVDLLVDPTLADIEIRLVTLDAGR